MFKLYGIPNCDTVKKARTFLEKEGVEFEFIDFKKSSPTAEDILRWSKAFNGLPINEKGVTFKKYKEEFEKLKDNEKIEFVIEKSSMIKRPILQNKHKVLAFGYNESEYRSIIK